MLRPARTDASRNDAACGVREPSSTRPSSRAARRMNLRMLTAEKPRLIPSSTTWRRCPSGSIASTNGRLTSTRRPLDLSIRSTSSVTCAVVSIRLVSSWRPLRAMKTRLGSLIQISSTDGSSRNGWSGPKPETRATSSPTTESTSGTGATAPVRLRSSCSRTTPSASRRTTEESRCGSTPSRRTSSRTCRSSSSTSWECASVSVIESPSESGSCQEPTSGRAHPAPGQGETCGQGRIPSPSALTWFASPVRPRPEHNSERAPGTTPGRFCA